MSDDFGLLPSGFVARRQLDIIDDMNTAITSSFGASADVSSTSVLGNLVGVFSEPVAQVWEAIEAVYGSQFAGSAEGNAVDEILALDDMQRNPASPTVTAPNAVIAEDGTLLQGLILYGDAGTVVSAGKIIQTTGTPALSFTLDEDVSIAPAVNAVQRIAFNQQPLQGSMTLTLQADDGTPLTTGDLQAPFDAAAITYQLSTLGDSAGNRPFSDVLVDVQETYIDLYFGLGTPPAGTPSSPSSGSKPQPLVVVTPNNLSRSTESQTILVSSFASVTVYGSAACGVGSATCTQTGPNAVPAGSLTVISTPSAGWSSVNNELACITGNDVETDTDALVRRMQTLNGAGAAKLASIKAAVRAVSGVTYVEGFENLTNCAIQNLHIPSSLPPGTQYALQLAQGDTMSLDVDAPARAIQDAINALPGYRAIVKGSRLYGFEIDFNNSLGGAAQPLIAVVPNNLNITVTFGRPPNAFEIVVNGGDDDAIRKAIQSAAPVGIGSYGQPLAQFSGNASRNNSAIFASQPINVNIPIGTPVSGPGIVPGTQVAGRNGQYILYLSIQPSSDAGGIYLFDYAGVVLDADNVPHTVSFTRGTLVLEFIAVSLLTDYYLVPGDASSGRNPYAAFDPATLTTVRDELVVIGNKTKPGGLVVVKGYSGLVGAFNNVPGVLDYSLALAQGDRATLPNISDPMPDNVQLLPGQAVSFLPVNVDIAWS